VSALEPLSAARLAAIRNFAMSGRVGIGDTAAMELLAEVDRLRAITNDPNRLVSLIEARFGRDLVNGDETVRLGEAIIAALADPVRLPEPEQRQAISDALNDDGTDPVAFQAALDEFLPEKGEPAEPIIKCIAAGTRHECADPSRCVPCGGGMTEPERCAVCDGTRCECGSLPTEGEPADG
jgi:hypothetical protein